MYDVLAVAFCSLDGIQPVQWLSDPARPLPADPNPAHTAPPNPTQPHPPRPIPGSLTYYIVHATSPDPSNSSRPERVVSHANLERPHSIPADAIIADVLSTHMDLKRPGG